MRRERRNIVSLPCFAHQANLCVGDVFKISPKINRCQECDCYSGVLLTSVTVKLSEICVLNSSAFTILLTVLFVNNNTMEFLLLLFCKFVVIFYHASQFKYIIRYCTQAIDNTVFW